MSKKFFMLASVAMVAAPAFAQSNVTVYGLVDAGVAFERGGSQGSITKVATGVQSGNRLGFKGVEDLGNGLSANFQIESGFGLDTGRSAQGNTLFGRQAHVGLASKTLGSVDVGRNYSLLFNTMDTIDPFNTGFNGTATGVMGLTAVRVNNSVVYTTPTMSGLTVSVLRGVGEVAGDSTKNSLNEVSATYANGPLVVSLAHSMLHNATATDTNRMTFLGAIYDFGPAKLHAAFENEKRFEGARFRDWMVGVTVPFGRSTVMASFIRQQDRSAADNAGADQFGLAYTYSLSKRTNLYASYGRINNDERASYYVQDASDGGEGNPVNAGANPSTVTLGIRHVF